MRRLALVAFVLGLVAFAIFAAVPFLGKQRDQPASITSPPPLQAIALDVVRPGRQLCMSGITIEPHSQQARFKVGTYTKPGPALEMTISGRGYRVARRVPAGYADNQTLSVRIRPPRASELVSVCLRNRGRVKIALYSAAERARSRASVKLGNRPVDASPTFGFWEARPRSIAGRAAATAERIAVFRGPLGYTWVVWLIAAATVLALTLGLALVLWVSDRPARARPRPDPR